MLISVHLLWFRNVKTSDWTKHRSFSAQAEFACTVSKQWTHFVPFKKIAFIYFKVKYGSVLLVCKHFPLNIRTVSKGIQCKTHQKYLNDCSLCQWYFKIYIIKNYCCVYIKFLISFSIRQIYIVSPVFTHIYPVFEAIVSYSAFIILSYYLCNCQLSCLWKAVLNCDSLNINK